MATTLATIVITTIVSTKAVSIVTRIRGMAVTMETKLQPTTVTTVTNIMGTIVTIATKARDTMTVTHQEVVETITTKVYHYRLTQFAPWAMPLARKC